MKIAIPWSTNPKEQFGDEYNISFDNEVNKFDTLFNFILNHKDLRFNIRIKNMTFQQMKALDNISDNVYFKYDRGITDDEHQQLKGEHLKFFFNEKIAPNCLILLEEQLELGVTDVYILDDLCYNLEKVRKMCNKFNVQVRTILNKIPSQRQDKGTNYKTPYFTPEIMDDLSEYIDVGEFETNSWTRIKTYYKIWFQKEEWKENINFLYPELTIDVLNQSLIPNFLTFRLNCGYRCGYGSVCNKCVQFAELAETLYKKGYVYNPEGEEGE